MSFLIKCGGSICAYMSLLFSLRSAAPIITVPPVAEIEVELGSTFTIICEAVGVPTPLIVWRLNWGNIPSGDRVEVISEEGRGRLTVSDARYEDAGAYTCEAINTRGSIFAIPDALVIVRRKLGCCCCHWSLLLVALNCSRITQDYCFCILCFSFTIPLLCVLPAEEHHRCQMMH